MTAVSLHPDLEPLRHLLGTWRGSGKGEYPRVDDFVYEEEITFGHSGRPLLTYLQRTWDPETGSARHSETGYWRPQAAGGIELVLAHSLGVVEISEGRATGGRIEVSSTSLVSSSTAKTITALARTLEVDGDDMVYDLAMAYADVPLQHHLSARLTRAS